MHGDGATVTSGPGTYQLHPEGARLRCTCQWRADHGGRRRPCKHELAVRIQQNPRATGPSSRASIAAVACHPDGPLQTIMNC